MPHPDLLGSFLPVWYTHPPAAASDAANRSYSHGSQETCPSSIEIASLEDTYLDDPVVILEISVVKTCCGISGKHQKESCSGDVNQPHSLVTTVLINGLMN